MKKTIRQRFVEKCDIKSNEDCWNWKAATRGTGYGVFAIDSKPVAAHRVSYELHIGPIPEGMLVCHKCDNPKCVNPNHLFLGSPADNIADRDAKNRQARQKGELNGASKLTTEDILRIRQLRRDGKSTAEIGRLFGIRHSQVSRICTGDRWAHVLDGEQIKSRGEGATTSYNRGSSNSNARFSDDDVADMRSMKSNGVSYKSIAEKYNARASTIWNICNGNSRNPTAR